MSINLTGDHKALFFYLFFELAGYSPMKFLLIISLFIFSVYGYSQDEKAALKYYNIGFEKRKDPTLKKKEISLEESFPYFFKAASLAKEGSDLQLKAIYQCAYLYNFAKKKEEKLIVDRRVIKGLSYVRKSQKKDSLTGEYFFRAGLSYIRDYRPDSAIYIFGEARKIFEGLKGDHSTSISNCYHLIGDVYKDILNDFTSAESYYEKVLDVYENAKDNKVNRFLTSKLYYELSLVNKSQHDYEKALAYSLKRINYAETLPTKDFPTASGILIKSYTNAADIYSEMGFVTDAVKLYQKAIALGLRVKEENDDLGDYYYGFASVYRRAGEQEQAIFYYEKALRIYDKTHDLKNVLRIKTCQRLGECYIGEKDFKKANDYFITGKKLLNQFGLNKSGVAAGMFVSIGNYFSAVDQPDSALIYYQRSLIEAASRFSSLKFAVNPEKENIVLTDFAYEALLAKSLTLSKLYTKTEKMNYAQAALASFELAEKLLVDSRARLDMDNAKWVFYDSNFGLYQQVLSLLYHLEQNQHNDSLAAKAFYFMESSKSKMLADALNESEFTNPLSLSDSTIRFLDLQKRNAYQLQDELRKQENNPVEQSRIRNLIVDTDRAIQKAEEKIIQKYPAYLKTKYQYDIPTLSEIQNLSKKKKTIIVEYFWGTSDVFGLAIHHDKVMFKYLGRTDSVQSALKSVYDLLSSDKYIYDSKEVNLFEQNANLVHQILVTPFEQMIETEQRLLILPDGPIEQVPFEVLVTTRTTAVQKNFSSIDYLVNKHVLSYSFSSAYLLNQLGSGMKSPRMLAFGFTDGKLLRSSDSEFVNNKLPGSELELKSISDVFPEGEYHFADDVTEQKFKEKAPEFDIIHLAVHGLGDTEQNYSASLFFHDKINSKDDGRLHWYEMFGLKLKARLAVISSCESGIGKSYRGEGMLSMASAFAFAGCKNIVMGLWKVDDRVSVNLMSNFYKNLRDEDPVDVALTKAKRSYLKQGDDLTANPKIWASLVCYGNEQIIVENEWKYPVVFILLILSCIGVVFYIKKKKSFFVE